MEIIEYQHVKPGKGGAFVRTNMRNLKTGNVLERTFRSGEKLEEPQVEERQMQYLYLQDGNYHFMDVNSYEQLFLTKEQMGDAWQFLKENTEVNILFWKGKPLGVSLPLFVELRIVETAPGIRGDTATGGTKPAPLVRHLAAESAVPGGNAPQGAPGVEGGEAPPESPGVVIRSPIVGTFYRSASPGAPPYVEVGDRVRRGQILCIVEAMKLLNEIEAEVDGVVAEIFLENARPVEYGEALFRIESA